MNLAQMNRAHMPKWLNIIFWIMAEAAIICTDIGQVITKFSCPLKSNIKADFVNQVIGTAIAINILIPQIPLVAGCALSITDTMFILLFYRPDGSLRGL